MFVIKLKMADASESAKLTHFYELPCWPDLSSKLTEIFGIPQNEVCFLMSTRAESRLREEIFETFTSRYRVTLFCWASNSCETALSTFGEMRPWTR